MTTEEEREDRSPKVDYNETVALEKKGRVQYRGEGCYYQRRAQ